jgi:hypothetical protein
MKTSIAIDKLINIAPIIADIRPKLQKDKKFKEFIENYKNGEDKTDNVDFVLKLLPVFLKDYKKEVYELLAIICDKSVEEVEEQSFGQTVKTIKELLADDDFKSFFIDA